MITHALTVRQPFAHAIAHLGRDIEHRTWSTPAFIGKRFAIHAGAAIDRDDFYAFYNLVDERGLAVNLPPEVDVSAIVAVAEIVGFVDGESASPWYESGPAFVLGNVRALDEPIYDVKGALGFWRLSPKHAARLAAL